MKPDKLCAFKTAWLDRHRIDIPILKERNRKEKRDERPQASSSPSQAHSIKSQGLRIILLGPSPAFQPYWTDSIISTVYWSGPTPLTQNSSTYIVLSGPFLL